MPAIVVPCPKCGKELKLRDRGLLGKKGRCPKCSHVFVLSVAPSDSQGEEVEFQLAEAPLTVTAQWVPEGAAAQATSPPPADTRGAAAPFGIEISESPAGGVEKLRELQRKKEKSRKLALIVGGISAVGLVVVLLLVIPRLKDKPAPVSEKPKVNQEALAARGSLEANAEKSSSESPTSGAPLKLLYVPHGPRIIFHIRPAELWKANSLAEQFRFSLADVGTWAEGVIKELCRYEPSEIESALICLSPTDPESPPQVSVVFRLLEARNKSELIEKFKGRYEEVEGRPIYVGDEQAYMLIDTKTVSICPADPMFYGEMVENSRQPATTSSGIAQLISKTDSDRHVTVMFEPRDLAVHRVGLFPEIARPFFDELVLWLNDEEVETVAWSLHFADETFYSELLVRNQATVNPSRLERTLHQKMDELPRTLWHAVEKMHPSKVGYRKLIGRFPAMMDVTLSETVAGIGPPGERYVQFVTVLPAKAAPNLGLGAVLAWDESTRTDFSKPATSRTAKPKLPDKVADRLKMKIDIEFVNTPLQECLQYFAEETHVTFKIDGDGLKDAGFTQNMPQTMNLGVAPAINGLHEILKKYAGEKIPLCLVVDEERKTVTCTTVKFAKKNNQAIYPVAPINE